MTGIEVVSESQNYPITPKEHGVDFLMDRRHLWIRAPRQQAILRIRHEVIDAVRDYFNSRHFILADTPIFTPAACEGTTTLFPVQYFEDNTAFLTRVDSSTTRPRDGARPVYCFGPTFRAEKSKTRRHLTEFWMVEPEMAYANLEDVMNLAEGRVVSIVERVLENRQRELQTLERDTAKLEVIKAPFPRISYDDAVDKLKAKGMPFEWGGDFGAPDETELSGEHDRPLFVHGFPSAIKAFYMKPHADRPEVSLSVDMLARKATAKSSAAASVSRISSCCCSGSRSTTCRRSVRVVSRPAPLWQRPAFRLRHGHRARRHLDLRHRSPARGYPYPRMCTGCIPERADARNFQHPTPNLQG